MVFMRRHRFIYAVIITCFICFVIIGYNVLSENRKTASNDSLQPGKALDEDTLTVEQNANSKDGKRDERSSVPASTSSLPNYNVHIFYYPWYGNPEFDQGSYFHWNHEYLPHWDKAENDKWPNGRHKPPKDIGSNFYPKLGCYSNRDPSVIEQHMSWIRSTEVGTVVLSWYPPGQSDSQGKPWDDITPMLMDIAQKYNLKVAFHIEPYANRTADTVRINVEYILNMYGSHPAFYFYSQKNRKSSQQQRPLPLFYIYDSYLTPNEEWRRLLRRPSDDGSVAAPSIRGTKLDSLFFGLLVKKEDKNALMQNGFDGFYTYFAANEFTYGSSWLHWKSLTGFGKTSKTLSSLSVGPGYVDDRVRPWNRVNVRSRENGEYYKRSWQQALDSKPDIVSIASFNEWHEGTQIEPSIPKKVDDYKYLDYTPYDPDYYLSLTKEYVAKFV